MIKATRHSASTILVPILRPLLCALLGCMAAVSVAAQPQLRVRTVHGLSLGAMFRSSESSAPYHSNNAAVFEVSGAKGAVVKFMLMATRLEQPDGPPNRNTMPLTVLPTHCAYSVDNGASWTPFNSHTLWQEARLPKKGGSSTTIMVRAGGRAVAAADQHRGHYIGAITLIAIYK